MDKKNDKQKQKELADDIKFLKEQQASELPVFSMSQMPVPKVHKNKHPTKVQDCDSDQQHINKKKDSCC